MDKNVIELSKYRYEQAKQCIKSANVLVAAEDYKGAANRSYYAIFHADIQRRSRRTDCKCG